MSVASPLIADWIKQGLKWRYSYFTRAVPYTLAPGEMYKIHEYKQIEGIFIDGNIAFDSPDCGMRLRAAPNLDTARTHLIRTYMLGATRPNVAFWAEIPPSTPPGVYMITVKKEWPWFNYFEIYIFNDDVVPHTFLGGGYTSALLEQSRSKIDEELLAKIKEAQGEK